MLEHEHPWIPTYCYITEHSKLDGQTTEEALMMAYGVWKGRGRTKRARKAGPEKRFFSIDY
jgi:hypothetical protein